MSALVFVGPTLPVEHAQKQIDAVFLPPAAQGDCYRAIREHPGVKAVGLIDGYFDRVPAVWHKELLWAMSQGIYVFGSASMGALRAVELAPFGMIGVGEIFRSFHQRELEDDDEVAVLHGPADTGYRSLSDAMCNIRATLAAAEDEGVLSEQQVRSFEAIAKRLPYQERSYRRLLLLGERAGLPAAIVARFGAWLPDNVVNQKCQDALDMLCAMRALLTSDPEPHQVDYVFEHTNAWEASCRRAESSIRVGLGASDDSRALFEELQVAGPQAHEAVLLASLARVMASLPHKGHRLPDVGSAQRQLDAFREREGLENGDAFARWQEEQSVTDPERLLHLFTEAASLHRAKAEWRPEVIKALADQLRLSSQYRQWRDRAAAKRALLSSRYLSQPSLADAQVDEPALWSWYFETALQRPIPRDLGGYAESAWFEDVTSMRTAVLRELCFRRLREPP